MPYKILALVAAGLALLLLVLVLAGPLPARYDVVVRLGVSAVAAWGTVVAVGEGRPRWAVTLGLTAVLFNPFYVAPLGAAVWAALAAAAALLVASSRVVGSLLGPTNGHGAQS